MNWVRVNKPSPFCAKRKQTLPIFKMNKFHYLVLKFQSMWQRPEWRADSSVSKECPFGGSYCQDYEIFHKYSNSIIWYDNDPRYTRVNHPVVWFIIKIASLLPVAYGEPGRYGQPQGRMGNEGPTAANQMAIWCKQYVGIGRSMRVEMTNTNWGLYVLDMLQTAKSLQVTGKHHFVSLTPSKNNKCTL